MSGRGTPFLSLARRTTNVMAQQARQGFQMAQTSLDTAAADFPTNFASGTDKAKNISTDAAEWMRANPGKATIYGTVGAISLVTVAAPAAVAAPLLGLVGFGGNGVIGGSLAAAIQSGIGNVIAPSLFATCQSAAAGGYGVAAVNAAVQAGGAMLAGSAAVVGVRGKNKGNDEGARRVDEETDGEEQDGE